MDRNTWVRQCHRWLSIAFTVAATVVGVVVATQKVPAAWVYLSPLLPLVLLVVTGLYLFALPYVVRRRRGRRAALGG